MRIENERTPTRIGNVGTGWRWNGDVQHLHRLSIVASRRGVTWWQSMVTVSLEPMRSADSVFSPWR